MTADTLVLDTLADITAASVEHNSLAPRELMLMRIAALIAMDAPPASYLANDGATRQDSGVTADDIGSHDRGCPGGGHGPGGLGRREDPPGAAEFAIAVAEPRWPTTGEAGLVAATRPKVEDAIKNAVTRAEKQTAQELDVDPKDIDKALQQAVNEM